MKQKKLTFQQVVARLEEAKIPCIVKRGVFNDNIEYTIEFGTNWPEYLVELVDKAFEAQGEKVPDYINLCGHSFNENTTDEKTIAGGPKQYSGYNKW
jgi:hypothetical protein